MKRFLPLLLLVALTVAPALAQVAPAPGWYAHKFLEGSFSTVSVTFGPDGVLYVGEAYDGTTNTHGRILALVDSDGNGLPDSTTVFTETAKWPLGLHFHDGWLYHTSRGSVIRYRDTDGDRVADVRDTVITDLPWGKSQTNGLVLGPDSLLYICQGAETNLGPQLDPKSATILRATPEGLNLEIFATGLRNSYDLAFHQSGELFAFDNGPDADSTLNCAEPPEELNWIREGNHYGFPQCFGVGDCAEAPLGCTPLCGAGDCAVGGVCDPGTSLPLLLLDPHSSADGLVFGNGVRGFDGDDLFFAEFGSFSSTSCFPGSGQRLARTRLMDLGGGWSVGAVEDVVLFDGYPVDVAVGPDSALYVADYGEGAVWRVVRTVPTAIPSTGSSLPRARLLAVPNPAREAVELLLDPLPETGGRGIRVRIYDIAGRRVRDLGTHSARWRWDLLDDRNRRVPAGIYLARGETPDGAVTVRLLVPSR
jgi:glucose/arabinose dehydrogenase